MFSNNVMSRIFKIFKQFLDCAVAMDFCASVSLHDHIIHKNITFNAYFMIENELQAKTVIFSEFTFILAAILDVIL